MNKCVFVCTGNTCRSNMAEVLAVQAASRSGLTGWQFSSAGIMAFPGAPASKNSLKTMQELGIDLSSHEATCLDEGIVKEAHLLLTMTHDHKHQILSKYPWAKHKVFSLLEYAFAESSPVEDPFGGDLEVYRRTSLQIQQAVARIIQRLKDF